MLNKAILMGRLTRDPETRYANDKPVCRFTLAVNRDKKGANGEQIGDFIDCVAWGQKADFIKKWFTKGMLAIVEGRIQSRNWEDKNGNKRTSVEVNISEMQFGETKKARQAGTTATPYIEPEFAELGDDEGDVPF